MRKIPPLIGFAVIIMLATWFVLKSDNHHEGFLSPKVDSNFAVNTATNYLKIPSNHPTESVKLALRFNHEVWEVTFSDYILPETVSSTTHVAEKYKVYVDTQTGEVVSYAAAGKVVD